uniref:RNA-directed DNA polymerase from mobile element jockey-like n=1 Tax=Saccoglossus kowalevskii TaxID=10224 RepID=A0ABM0MRX3_SACKO
NRISQDLSTIAAFVDLRKAFDSVDRDALLYKLLINGINGKMYKSIRAMYSDTNSSVKLNDFKTDWFNTEQGVRQCDNLSPTLFSIFINDLAVEINLKQKGITLDNNVNVSILLYADDIVLLADNEIDMQMMLSHLNSWCEKWKIRVNNVKSKMLHFRKASEARSAFQFCIGDDVLDYTDKYKYLGIVLDEFVDYPVTAGIAADSASRALGALFVKFKTHKNLEFSTFTKLYDASVAPILDYCSGVWGFSKFEKCEMIQNRALRFFLGTHRFSPLPAVKGDTGWV